MNPFTLIFTSRKVWIALGALAAVIITVLGLDPAKWTPVITAIVSLASVVIAAIGYEDGQEKGNVNSQFAAPADQGNASGPTNSSSATVAKLLIAGLLVGVALCGVGCANTVGPDYLAADRATYEAVGRSYLNYVADDATLTAEQKLRRQRTVTTWQMRIESQEKLASPATTQPATN